METILKILIEFMKRVKRRATKLMKSLKYKRFENRLKKLHLASMKAGRLQGGYIQVLTMIKVMDNLDVNKGFELN